jgi:hypothetical protein
VKEELQNSASEFGQSALHAYLDKNWAVFLLHAATSLEHLLKASLASRHAALIAAADFDSLLHACELSPHAHTPASLMKTIGARDALERCGRLIPSIDILKKELNLLVDVRNGVVHLGHVDKQAAKQTLTPFLKASDHLLSYIRADKPAHWGDLQDLVTARLSDSIKESEVRAMEAVTSAKVEFGRRFGGIADTTLRDGLLKSIESTYSPAKYEEQLVDCPSCGRLALVSGAYEVEWEPDYDYADGESFIAGVYPVVTFYPGHLSCRVCELELDGEDELETAGIKKSWELEDIDSRDFYEPELA